MQVQKPTQLEDLMMAMVGLETMAYIKPMHYGEVTHYAVFAADGTQLATFDDFDTAHYNAVKHNLDPTRLH